MHSIGKLLVRRVPGVRLLNFSCGTRLQCENRPDTSLNIKLFLESRKNERDKREAERASQGMTSLCDFFVGPKHRFLVEFGGR